MLLWSVVCIGTNRDASVTYTCCCDKVIFLQVPKTGVVFLLSARFAREEKVCTEIRQPFPMQLKKT